MQSLDDALHAALHMAQSRLTDAMAARGAALPLSFCHTDAARGRIVAGIAEPAPALQRSVRALAGGVPVTFVPAAHAIRHANKTAYNRPLIGGLLINCPDAGGAGAGVGTICMGLSRAGVPGFVTCGHVVEKTGINVYQPRRSDVNDWLVGQSTVVSNYSGNALSDSAFVAAAGGVAIAELRIWKSSATSYAVTGIYDATQPGVAVSMQGASTATTLRNGIVCGTNVTVTFADGGVLTGQLLANYLSTEGDSGAPTFFTINDESVLIVGLNVGATLPAHAVPPPNPALYPPAANGTYAIVSPWRNVEHDLGL